MRGKLPKYYLGSTGRLYFEYLVLTSLGRNKEEACNELIKLYSLPISMYDLEYAFGRRYYRSEGELRVGLDMQFGVNPVRGVNPWSSPAIK